MTRRTARYFVSAMLILGFIAGIGGWTVGRASASPVCGIPFGEICQIDPAGDQCVFTINDWWCDMGSNGRCTTRDCPPGGGDEPCDTCVYEVERFKP
jgi:hypothetical protein